MLKNPSEDCRTILRYWMSSPISDMPLTAQLIAWRKFRAYHQQTRHRLRDFEHQRHQFRQKYGLAAGP
jgi:hypothetical protein